MLADPVYISLNLCSVDIIREILILSISRYQNSLSNIIQDHHGLLLHDKHFHKCCYYTFEILYLQLTSVNGEEEIAKSTGKWVDSGEGLCIFWAPKEEGENLCKIPTVHFSTIKMYWLKKGTQSIRQCHRFRSKQAGVIKR